METQAFSNFLAVLNEQGWAETGTIIPAPASGVLPQVKPGQGALPAHRQR
jgi:hypothetical protein